MGLEAVKEEVIRQAKQQETSLLAEARKESNKIMAEAEKRIEEMKEKSDADSKRTAELLKRQAMASAELECRKLLLDAKKQVLENVLAEVKEKLENLEDKKREEIIKKLLEKTGKEIEIANVYCSKKDMRLVKGLNAEAANIIGGIIAENKDKTIRVNYSFETILDGIKEKELQNINKLLFG